jgi:hypothetical protein
MAKVKIDVRRFRGPKFSVADGEYDIDHAGIIDVPDEVAIALNEGNPGAFSLVPDDVAASIPVALPPPDEVVAVSSAASPDGQPAPEDEVSDAPTGRSKKRK